MEEIGKEDYLEVSINISSWINKSIRLKREAGRNARDLFSDSEIIINMLDDKMKLLSSTNHCLNERVVICKDPENTLQAIAVIQYATYFYKCSLARFIKIDLIATNPENLHQLKSEEKLRGAGIAIIYKIAQTCFKEGIGRGVILNSLDSSISFYTRLGFKRISIFCKEFFLLTNEEFDNRKGQWELKLKEYNDSRARSEARATY